MSADLAELEDSAQKVLAKIAVPAAEDKTWSAIIDLGWLLVAVPEDLGGLGQGLPGACALYRELGRGLACAPYLSAMLAIEAVCHGELSDREGWVERLAAGDYVAAPLAKSMLAVSKSGSGAARLTGTASAVPSVDKASHTLICASAGDCVALVPLGQSGVEITPRPTWDATRRLADVRFTSVEVDEALVVARGPAAQELRRKLAVHRDFALAANSVGGAAALLDLTIEYLGTRRQFGRPLAMFQALKHRCADLKMHTAAAEALLLDGLSKLAAQGVDEAETMGKMAKSLACSVFARVGEEAIQLHGGIAMTSEHSCHLFVKRALLNEHLGRDIDSYDLDIAASFLSKP